MKIQNRAEKILSEYRTSDPKLQTAMCLLFLKNVCGWIPYPHQIYYIDMALHHSNVLCYAPPRAGKTMALEAVCLYQMAVNSFEDYRIYVPKFDQGKDALKYHYDWIDGSKLLKAHLRKMSGKPVFSRTEYQFNNRSNAKIYSIRGEIEGHNVTIMRVEEFDDWAWEKFANDVIRRTGAKNKNGLPTRVRISGTIMGQENIYKIVEDKEFSRLFQNLSEHPDWGKIDAHLLEKMGVLDSDALALQKKLMTPDEWARSGLLLFTESRNFIYQSYLRAGIKKSAEWGLEPVPMRRGGKYAKIGTVAVGFDCGHAGTSEESSRYSLQIFEQTGGFRRWLNGFRWEPDYDPKKLKEEIVEILAYYQPDGGYGDALKMNDIRTLNEMCWNEGVSTINPNDFAENKQSNWDRWFISPLHNTGKSKHDMYTALKDGIHNGSLFFPYYDKNDTSQVAKSLKNLLRTIVNIRSEKTTSFYPRYFGINKKIGDDDTDAAGMALKWLNDHTESAVNFGLIGSIGGSVVTSGIKSESAHLDVSNFGAL